MKENVRPIFQKARPIPFALKGRVKEEIDRLVRDKLLIPVETSEWATPIVPVIKKNGQVRLCGDYSVTINPHMKIVRYP